MLQLTGEAINALHRIPGRVASSPLLFDLQGGNPLATWLLVKKNILRREQALWKLGLLHNLESDRDFRLYKLKDVIPKAKWYAALFSQ